jgi:hypothetical protein
MSISKQQTKQVFFNACDWIWQNNHLVVAWLVSPCGIGVAIINKITTLTNY